MKKLIAFAMLLLSQQAFSLDSSSIYNSKSEWENQDGIKKTLTTLRGKSVVMAMLYTSCPTSCPLTMADLRKIEKKLSPRARQKVRFAVFSFDSERDTPEKLKTYLQKQKLDATRWTFFHGDGESVRELAVLLGIQFKKIEGGDFDHSNVISVLNPEGVVVYQQVGSGQSPENTVAVLEKLISKKRT